MAHKPILGGVKRGKRRQRPNPWPKCGHPSGCQMSAASTHDIYTVAPHGLCKFHATRKGTRWDRDDWNRG